MYVDMFQNLFTIRSRGGRRSNTTDRIGHSGRAKQDRQQSAIITILKVQASTTRNEVRTNQEIATDDVKIRYHKCMNTDWTHRDWTIQPPTMKSSNAKSVSGLPSKATMSPPRFGSTAAPMRVSMSAVIMVRVAPVSTTDLARRESLKSAEQLVSTKTRGSPPTDDTVHRHLAASLSLAR